VDRWRCGYCDELIGVYEPMVVLLPAGSRVTSRAAERELADVPEASFHRSCFDAARAHTRARHDPRPRPRLRMAKLG